MTKEKIKEEIRMTIGDSFQHMFFHDDKYKTWGDMHEFILEQVNTTIDRIFP